MFSGVPNHALRAWLPTLVVSVRTSLAIDGPAPERVPSWLMVQPVPLPPKPATAGVGALVPGTMPSVPPLRVRVPVPRALELPATVVALAATVRPPENVLLPVRVDWPAAWATEPLPVMSPATVVTLLADPCVRVALLTFTWVLAAALREATVWLAPASSKPPLLMASVVDVGSRLLVGPAATPRFCLYIALTSALLRLRLNSETSAIWLANSWSLPK